VLVRYANGIHGEFFYQKRAPASRPAWIEVAALRFPSGRQAEEVVPRDAASLAWMANLGCLELHPHPVRASDLEHPDELRIDLDPQPGIAWEQIVEVARVAREVLSDLGLVGWPKTSGSRGIHVNVRIHPRWSFTQGRRAALAFAREVERRVPALATSRWWKEERHGVFLDYNQNAKDRTVAGAYSVRPRPDARVSAPVTWDELFACRPEDFTLRTMPARFAAVGDRHAGIDDAAGSLESLLELSARQEAEGQGDAPWPPHYAKQDGEPARVAPSRAAKAPGARS
jgi:DNA ligase D-like protein (predicted polymerase)